MSRILSGLSDLRQARRHLQPRRSLAR
jgi:hypothetical protein